MESLLPGFFEALGDATLQRKSLGLTADRLGELFAKLEGILPPQAKPTKQEQYKRLADVSALNMFLAEDIKEPLIAARRGGFLCDPWDVAGLKRDEVRNSRVLAWMLDPRESHGFGSVFLRAVVEEVLPEIIEVTDDRYRYTVRTESSPDGDSANRLDIEIEALDFYLVIEVKIDAAEGERQVARYAEVCDARAKGKPWKIVFLTPAGRKALSAGEYEEYVVPMAWGDLSRLLDRSLRETAVPTSPTSSREMFAYHLVEWFLKHVDKF